MMMEKFGRDKQPGSSALDCGHLKLWVMKLVSNAKLSRTCIRVVVHQKVYALKLCHLTACPAMQGKWFFAYYSTASQGRKEPIHPPAELGGILINLF
jgi:hypothetical protein